MKRLDQKFYNRDTLRVAKELLGKYIVRQIGQKKLAGKIVETEAYMGYDDLASHASRGRTPRTEIMFGKAGVVYIYLIYGMYYMFNIVTEKKDFPAAVLIRAAEPIIFPGSHPGKGKFQGETLENLENGSRQASGPGKLCKYFRIDKSLNGEDLTSSKKLYIEDRGEKISKNQTVAAKRIGVDYAKHCKDHLWRFYIKNNLFVSRR